MLSQNSLAACAAALLGLALALPVLADEPLDTVLAKTGLRAPRHGVYVVAHRGAHRGIPENTLAAYRKAIELGCDFVEIDVRTTRDGQFAILHNSRVDNYTHDTTGRVRDFTLAELKALDIGSRIGPEWANERIPSFDEVLDLCKGRIGIYLDLKDGSVPALVDRIRAHGMEKDVIWYAGISLQRQVQNLCPECIPMPDPGPERFLEPLFGKLDPPPRVIASVQRFCSKTFVQTAHDHGAIVITDEENATPADWQALLDWGNDGIQTDDAQGLIAYLEQRK